MPTDIYTTYEGTGANRVLVTFNYMTGEKTVTPAPETTGATGSTSTNTITVVPQTYTFTNPNTGVATTYNSLAEYQTAVDLFKLSSEQAFSESQLLKNQLFTKEQTLAGQQFQQSMYNQSIADSQMASRQSAYSILMDEFSKYGLGSLVEPLKSMLTENVSPAEFSIRLRQTEAYKQRFIANDARIANGLRALGPAEYLNLEDSYRQILRNYGLKQFDNDTYVRKFIENDMSPAELNTRVVNAVERVQMADPSIKNTIQQYYGLSDIELTAYVLDPKNQLPQIERRIQASEIGGAALTQGLTVGVDTAEQLAAYGVTQNKAREGYQAIGEMLPGATRLSNIYGSTLESYGQTQAEEEVFKGTASAKRARERLIGREIGSFAGQAGVTRGSLESGSKGNF